MITTYKIRCQKALHVHFILRDKVYPPETLFTALMFRFVSFLQIHEKKIAAQWKTLSFNYIIVPIINVEIAYHSFCLWVKRVLAFRIDKCFLTGVDEFCDLLYYYMVAILGYYKSIFFLLLLKSTFIELYAFLLSNHDQKCFEYHKNMLKIFGF